MKKKLFILAMALMALCVTFESCQKENNNDNNGVINDGNDNNVDPSNSQFLGVYDLTMVYDSITTSDGEWLSEEFYEMATGKVNPPEHGYLTIEAGQNGKLNVTATFVKENEEKTFFSTTATEKDGILILDNCKSDYYYTALEDYITFTFHGFSSNLPEIFFKGIYTINLGYDYSYLNSYTCIKRS